MSENQNTYQNRVSDDLINTWLRRESLSLGHSNRNIQNWKVKTKQLKKKRKENPKQYPRTVG